jgi:hypothetical protein
MNAYVAIAILFAATVVLAMVAHDAHAALLTSVTSILIFALAPEVKK